MGPIIDLSTSLNRKTTDEEVFQAAHFDTEIIHLQSYDNFYSLMDRLHQRDASGQGSKKLLLIWSVRGKILETPMEFGRLRGWAVRNHYEIEMVIPNDDISRKLAIEQGIPAFKSIKEAGESPWNFAEKQPDPAEPEDRIRQIALLKKDVENVQHHQSPFITRLFFFLLTIAVLAGMSYAIFPQAKLEITPYLTRKSINMTIWTDERLDAPTLAGGIPTIEKKYELMLTANVPASGQIQTEPGIAIGEIHVRNICDRNYPSSSGVLVGTSEDFETGINFITLDDAMLAPGEEKVLRIEAVNGGTSGNLPAGSIQYAEYPKSICWEVIQFKPTAGGSSGTLAAPTEVDRQRAMQNINEQIPQAVEEAIKNDPEGANLLALGAPVVTAVKSVQQSPDTGYVSETLTLRETVEVSIKTVSISDIETIIRGQSARLNVPTAQFTGYEILSGPTEENGLSTWSIRADYLVYDPATNEEALQTMLRGKTVQQAYAIINSLEHIKSAKITLLPSGMKHMPLAAQNIRVIIYPAIEAEEL